MARATSWQSLGHHSGATWPQRATSKGTVALMKVYPKMHLRSQWRLPKRELCNRASIGESWGSAGKDQVTYQPGGAALHGLESSAVSFELFPPFVYYP